MVISRSDFERALELRKERRVTAWIILLMGAVIVLDLSGVPLVSDGLISLSIIGLMTKFAGLTTELQQVVLEFHDGPDVMGNGRSRRGGKP